MRRWTNMTSGADRHRVQLAAPHYYYYYYYYYYYIGFDRDIR